MGYSVVFAAKFEDDVDSILDYHINHLQSPKAAQTLLDDLDNALDLIQRIPTINAISGKPLLGELEYREQFVRNYVVLYRFDGETVYVMRMFHLTQDFETLIEVHLL